MTQEEKARAYDKAIEKIKYVMEHGVSPTLNKEDLQDIFPQLKESEDERMIREISEFILSNRLDAPYEVEDTDRWLAWLEKQGVKDNLNIVREGQITHEDICKAYKIPDIGEFSDGYHTFNSLYHQRMILFAVLVKTYKDKAWKSWKHEDGELCFGGGWFVVGIDTSEGTYTYHYKAKDWDRFDCAALKKAKHWDGHTDADVERLFSLLQPSKSEIANIEEINKDKHYQSIMQMLQSIYEVLVSINNKNAPVQIVPDTLRPLGPHYETEIVNCNITNKNKDEKSKTNL